MKYLLIFSIIINSNLAFGQGKVTKSFSGKFEGGTASYSYYENDNSERIYNGKFAYSGYVANYDGLKVNINGNFVENQRDGFWIFSVKNIKSPISKLLGDKERYAIRMAVQLNTMTGSPRNKDLLNLKEVLKNNSFVEFKTYKSVLKGNYINGKLDGIWTFTETSIGGDKRKMTNEKNLPVYSIVSFKDNKLIGDFMYKHDEKYYVSGQFNKNGYLIGKWVAKWVFNGNEYENISEYENGTLIKMIERNASTGEILFRDFQGKGKGKKIMSDVIMFWIGGNDKNEFNKLPISKRNYMFKFDKGFVKPTRQEAYEVIKVVKDEISEIDVNNEGELDVSEDVPFAIIENAPIYPGCEGKPKSQQKKCLSDNITKLVNNKFNVDLATDLGLKPRRKRIFVMFKIDNKGKVVNITVLAPHKGLEKEAIRVIGLIPKMKPGKHNGRAVGVKYSLPIIFTVTK